MSAGGPSVTFVVPVRNGERYLHGCLAAIMGEAGDAAAHEVIVVDNGSTDRSAEIARQSGARVVERPGLRVGGCRNQGAAAGRGEILVFVDADNEIEAGWLGACLRAFEDDQVGAAGQQYRSPSPGTWVQRIYDSLRARPSTRHDIEWLSAGNLAVRRRVFDAVGGFDEGLEACEDVDLCRAVRAAGFRVVNEPGMASVHHGDPRTLSALFFGELWRGRDNIRVSLRAPLRLATLPSVLLPVASLACMALSVAGLASWPWIGPWLALTGAIGLGAIAALKAAVIVVRGRLRSPLTWLQGLAVAVTYESARALSLVASFGHGTRARVV